MEKLKIGIIGAGRIGQLHAANILQSNLLDLKMIADVKIDHLRETYLMNALPVLTNDPNDIFADTEIDAVFICSSTDTHVDFIKKAAEAEKHVFCEKPISFDLEATKEALQVVKEKGVQLQVGFNRRYDKHFRKVYDLVRSGGIGNPHIIKISSRDPEAPPEEYVKRSGGMFIDMTIHDFDMARYLCGSEVEEVSVKAANLVNSMFSKYDDIDTAVITLTFKNGAIAVIDNSREAVYGYDQRIEVFGNKGVAVAENEANTNVQVSTSDGVHLENPKHFFLERYKEAFVEEIADFAQAIKEDRNVRSSGEDAYKAQLLAKSARLSWKENRSVAVKEFDVIN